MTTTFGLDLSLCKTGIVSLRDGVLLGSGLAKSKPSGETPTDEAWRIKDLADSILLTMEVSLKPGEKPDMVLIEGLAFMARNTTALVQLSGLSYLIRVGVLERGWPMCIVAPTSLKKFIVGKGNADKNLMMMTVFRDYGFESLDDNIADAYALAACGQALLGKPIHKLTVPQQEVIKLLEKQNGKQHSLGERKGKGKEEKNSDIIRKKSTKKM